MTHKHPLSAAEAAVQAQKIRTSLAEAKKAQLERFEAEAKGPDPALAFEQPVGPGIPGKSQEDEGLRYEEAEDLARSLRYEGSKFKPQTEALAPYQQRVVEEKEVLDLKLEALTLFTCSEAFTQVHFMEQERLICQRYIMCQYSAILGERIRNFEESM